VDTGSNATLTQVVITDALVMPLNTLTCPGADHDGASSMYLLAFPCLHHVGTPPFLILTSLQKLSMLLTGSILLSACLTADASNKVHPGVHGCCIRTECKLT
jgi:hypothetical protein